MTAQLLAFRKPAPQDAAALLEAVVELHALISIDPVMGASPARVYFVLNPAAKARIAVSIDAADTARAAASSAYAVMAYDFPFALHLIEIAGRAISTERAKAIATASADLQRGAFRAAADAAGIEAQAVAAFDAEALKAAFFPQTQETVIHLFRLELQR
jgi:3-hydroxypropanoate dehydrogenase